MIIEFLIDIGFSVFSAIFALLPDLNWSVTSSAWVAAKSILNGICYFLPLQTVSAIASLIIAIAFIRIAIGFIRLILSFIPFF